MSARFRLKALVPGYVLLVTALLKLAPFVLTLTLSGDPVWEAVTVRVTFFAWLAMLSATAWWIYSLHVDLERLVKGYPISEGAALAAILVPIYNLWGFWTVWNAAAIHLRQGRPYTVRQGAVTFYALWIARLLLGWFLRGFAGQPNGQALQLVIILLEALSWAVLYIPVMNGLRQLRDARVKDDATRSDLLSALK